uniref:Serine protease n=1 Tax=Riboviria sp. TaxID=2585031 RepID=A0A8K1U3Z5_9VIRU|nr:MAG: hypothetical protein 2 [Riboviria sp.]
MSLMMFVTMVMIVSLLVNRVRKISEIDNTHGFQAERSVPGSELINQSPPNFQASVLIMADGIKRKVGEAFRVPEGILTAKHNLIGADRVFLSAGGKEVEVKDEPKELDQDVVLIPYANLAALELGMAKLVKVSVRQQVMVNNGTHVTWGEVHPATAVGYVNYTGSTLPGFSGAPYYIGKRVVGMHTGAGVLNMGYDGAFLHAILTKSRKESEGFSTDAQELYREMAERGQDLEYKVMSNDFYTVRVGGVYKVYSEEEFDEAMSRYNKRRSAGAQYSPENAVPAKVDWEAMKRRLVSVQPAETGSSFTFQDAEAGNGYPPVAPVIRAAGESSASPAMPAPHSVSHAGVQTESLYLPESQGITFGRTLQPALRSAVSRLTSKDLETFATIVQSNQLTTLEARALMGAMVGSLTLQ